ncbi:SDR family oxidoreductase [Devosia sp. FKR38]|uniref:SDR family NAD(P)-dependent oxidoreductase n=1 Tax=Devosia sp. FKR38 TaxID=2562312 RepID=UPI0010C0CE38|nr:SDR family oxidoreductase [Devosia sp. FKR38]
MQQGRRRHYFVTGASSGIGLSLARSLAGQGHDVTATGQRAPADLSPDFPDIAYHQLDLSGPAAPLIALAAPADRVVLAAGTGFYRPLEHEDPAALTQAMAVNLGSVIRLLHGLYPTLARQAGRVALLGSVADKGSAGMPVYSASKGALAGLARSLSAEWADRITVRYYRLWPTRTPMHARAGYDARKIDWLLMDPDRVARFVIDHLEGGGRASKTISPLTMVGRR